MRETNKSVHIYTDIPIPNKQKSGLFHNFLCTIRKRQKTMIKDKNHITITFPANKMTEIIALAAEEGITPRKWIQKEIEIALYRPYEQTLRAAKKLFR